MIRNNRHKTEVLLSTAKRLILSVCMVAFPLSVCLSANGQIQLVGGIKTIAGDGTSGDTGNGGAATSAELDLPVAAAVDTAGNIYVADRNANVIREVSAVTGVITTVAGNGTAGFAGDGAAATSAELNQPGGVAVDTAGNIYIADFSNNRIRKVTVATGVITTVVGNGTAGFSGDAGLATSAELNVPNGVAFDITGNLYIADDGNNRIRKVTIATGVITTVAGNGTAGFSGDAGVPTSAELHGPTSVAIDSTGDIYIADYYNNRIRMVNVITGLITTVAGDGTAGFLGDGGAATSAELNVPASVALDKGGNLYIADQSNNRIREVTLGVINTVAGDGVAGLSGNNGAATSAEVNAPVGVATDSAGDLYIADSGNSVIREVVLGNNFPTTNIAVSSAVQDIFLQTTAAETITSITIPQSQNATQEYSVGTISGCSVGGASNPAGTICVIPVTFTPAYPGQRRIPLQVVTSAGNINFGLQGMGVGPLATLTPGIITTVAGGGTVEGDGGVATSAALSNPYNATADSAGNLYIADVSDQRIRKVAAGTGIITTVAGTGTAGFSGDGGLATAAQLNNPSGVKVDSAGNLYIADGSNHRVRKVTAATGIITTVAGSGISNGGSLPTGQGGPATSAQMASPYDVAIDSAGNLFISDGTDNCIYKVAGGTGVLTKYAGTSCTNTSYNFSGDGGLATGAYLNAPCGINLDNQDNLYIADQTNERIRKITASTGIITTVAGNGAPAVGAQGDGGLATNGTFYQPCGIAIDNAGNLYIGDQFSKIRFVNAATGILSTIVGFGDANSGFSGDGGAATKAQVNYPLGVALDNQGNLYIGDYKNERIREVNMSLSQLTYPTATTVGTLDATDDPQKVIVQNVGNGSLTIPPPTTGSNLSVSTSFVFDSSSTCPQLFTTSASDTLISGQSCTYALDFEPTLAGSISGSAVLTDNSLNVIGSTQTINMSGTGLAVATTTQVTSSANPSAYTQSVTFTATVTPTTGTAVPTGTVQFKIGGVATGTPVTVGASGTATFTTSTLAVGSYSITAVYTPDDSTFTTSTATAINQVVNKATPGLNGVPAITVTSTPNPSNFNQSVTFTAAVPTGATGTVNFLDGTTLLGTGTISGTTATFTTTTLIVASHPVTGV
jgi:trimeric autotransporter adhesin